MLGAQQGSTRTDGQTDREAEGWTGGGWPAGSSVRSYFPCRAGGCLWLRDPPEVGLPGRHQGTGFQTQSVCVSPQPDPLGEARRSLHLRTQAERGWGWGATLRPQTQAAPLGHSPHPRLYAQPRPAAPSPRAPPPMLACPLHPGWPLFCPSLHPTQAEPGLSSAPSAWKSLGKSGSPGLAWTDPAQVTQVQCTV